jgi:hypothetical protein
MKATVKKIMSQKWSGFYLDAHEFIKKIAKEKGAEVGSDDFTVE